MMLESGAFGSMFNWTFADDTRRLWARECSNTVLVPSPMQRKHTHTDTHTAALPWKCADTSGRRSVWCRPAAQL